MMKRHGALHFGYLYEKKKKFLKKFYKTIDNHMKNGIIKITIRVGML